MLTTQLGITTAYFSQASEIKREEVLAADIISVRGHHPLGIYHSSHMMWRGDIRGISNPLEFIRSKREKQAQPKVIQEFSQKQIVLLTKELSPELLTEFKLLYEKTTLKKDRHITYDIDGIVASRQVMGATYYISGLWDVQQKLVSGLLFSIRNKVATVSFGAKERFQDIRGGVGGACEYELIRFCKTVAVEEIIHGLGKNPVGIYTNAGLFEFKARYGFTAFPNEFWQTTFIRNLAIRLSDLVFISIDNNQLCYTVVSDLPEKEVVKKYKAREVPLVKVIPFSELEAQYQQLLQTLPE